MTLQRMRFLETFQCLGDRCGDTCCKGWGMQLDPATRERYVQKAPELLDAVDTGEAEFIMRRDPATDYCVKFDAGLCGIHKNYGTDFLGDACHFFPRITRKIGQGVVQTASMSCPEVARLMLCDERAFEQTPTHFERIPNTVKDYLSSVLTEEQTMQVHQAFMDAALAGDCTAQRAMSRIVSVAYSLERIDQQSWPLAAGFYLANADGRLPVPETSVNDPFNLLHALCGLVRAAKKTSRPRLDAVIGAIEELLACRIDAETGVLQITDASASRGGLLKELAKEQSAHYDASLHRWLAGQLSVAFFPFSGFGGSLFERASIIAVRMATVRLALIAAHHQAKGLLSLDAQVDVIQPLSRFLDHLADPTLSVAVYHEAGWLRESRLRALLYDE